VDEQRDLPHLRSIFSQPELVKLGQQVEAVKKIAPHQAAPQRTRRAAAT
jgi:hypothetical protein